MSSILTQNLKIDRLSYVYVLVDPRNKEPFYVGKTNDPDNRVIGHISDGRKYRIVGDKTKPSIIKEILEDGFEPIMRIIEITTERYVYEREFTWWQGFIERGYQICNTVNYGREYSVETVNLIPPPSLISDNPEFIDKPSAEYTVHELQQLLEMVEYQDDRRRIIMMLLAFTADTSEWPIIEKAGESYIARGHS